MSKQFRIHSERVNDFAEAVRATRQEGTGIAIKYIAKVFKEYFDSAELECLIRELK